MILSIIKHPSEVLSQRCEPIKRINKDLVQLGKDMLETLKSNSGLGLAANQVGMLHRIIVITVKDKPLLMYNPTIMSQSTTRRAANEKCLSFSVDEEYSVKRPTFVKVKFQDMNSKVKFLHLEDLEARCFFHEHDHLLGVTMDVNGEKIDKD
jgi:peptide deformylase